MSDKIIMTYVSDYDPKTRIYTRQEDRTHSERVFKNKDELIRAIATYIDRNNSDDPDRWTSKWIESQNLTGTDIQAIKTWDENVIHYYRNIWFHTESGSTIDIRDYWKDAVKLAIASDRKLIRLAEKPNLFWYLSRRHHKTHPTSHRIRNFRNINGIGRLIRYATAEVHYEDNKYTVRIRPRGRDLELRFCSWDDFYRNGTAGWKSKKHRYQWEHNVVTKERHKRNKIHKLTSKGESVNELH